MSNINNYTKADLEFIHLLAKRGLSLEYSLMVVDKEKVLKHSNGNLRSIMKLFCRVSELTTEEIRTSTDKRTIWVKHMFCYYCKKNTSITNECIANYVGLTYSAIGRIFTTIENDYEMKYQPTIKFLKTIKNETLKTKEK
mgnify:CR=1 FL=1|tara:strand:+ start:111 stop:530 length:420 start_codon:yes stop_codon:yes gene_type:complete